MILSAKDIYFSYGSHQVLSGVSLDVGEGKVICIMGPNGSGKTTLLDCLMGINKVEKGSIELFEKDIYSMSRKDIAKDISYMPQIHGVSFPYTVREFVLMGRMAYAGTFGSPGEKDFEACEAAIEKAGLKAYADMAYSSLSGGELRLCLLARALCQDAKVIMMDEPTAHLDFRNEMLFLERVAMLAKEGAVSVVMSTHSPNHALMLESLGVSTKAMLLKDGKVYMKGNPSEVIDQSSIAEVFGVEAKIVDIDGMKNMFIKGAI